MLNQPHFRGNNNATPRQFCFNKNINVLIIILNDESVRQLIINSSGEEITYCYTNQIRNIVYALIKQNKSKLKQNELYFNSRLV